MFEAIVTFNFITFAKGRATLRRDWLEGREAASFADKLVSLFEALRGDRPYDHDIEVARRPFVTLGPALEFKLLAEDDEFTVEIVEV